MSIVTAEAALDVPLKVATLMVSFGPVAEGQPPFCVRLKGQSCEKSLDNDMDVNETTSNEKKAASDPTAGAAMSLG